MERRGGDDQGKKAKKLPIPMPQKSDKTYVIDYLVDKNKGKRGVEAMPVRPGEPRPLVKTRYERGLTESLEGSLRIGREHAFGKKKRIFSYALSPAAIKELNTSTVIIGVDVGGALFSGDIIWRGKLNYFLGEVLQGITEHDCRGEHLNVEFR